MALIPKPPFPNIPKLPGVPQLPRSPAFPAGPPPILGLPIALGQLWQALRVTPQWGIYDDADNLVLRPTNYQDMGYRNEQTVSNFPVQAGAFAAYNAVDNPAEIRLRLTKADTEQARADFISDALFMLKSLSRYRILTPERTYLNMKVTAVDIQRRGAAGAFFLSEVDITFMEIRQVAAQFSSQTANAQNPAALPFVNNGIVQAIEQIPLPNAPPIFDPATSLGVTP